MKRLGVVLFGMAEDFQFNLAQNIVVRADELQVHRHAGADAGIGESFGDTLTIGFIGDLLSNVGKIVLTVGVLDVGQQFRAMMHQMHPSA